MYACLAVTWHLHFWQNDRDFLRATVVTRGWNGYRNKSQHRKSTLEKKILPPFQQGFEPATFQSRVRRSNHWAILAPRLHSEIMDLYMPVCRSSPCLKWCHNARASLFRIVSPVISGNRLLSAQPIHWSKLEKKETKRINNQTASFLADWGSFSSQRRLRYFALLLKVKDRRSAEYLAFIRHVCDLFCPYCCREMRGFH